MTKLKMYRNLPGKKWLQRSSHDSLASITFIMLSHRYKHRLNREIVYHSHQKQGPRSGSGDLVGRSSVLTKILGDHSQRSVKKHPGTELVLHGSYQLKNSHNLNRSQERSSLSRILLKPIPVSSQSSERFKEENEVESKEKE